MSGTTIGPGEMTENWQNSCLHTLGFCISQSYFREYALFSYGKRKSGRKKERKEEREKEGGKEEQKFAVQTPGGGKPSSFNSGPCSVQVSCLTPFHVLFRHLLGAFVTAPFPLTPE